MTILTSVLTAPAKTFFKEVDKMVLPVKQVVDGLRKQLIIDVQEELFGQPLENIWRENNLQYIGMVLLVPRVLCLFILLFGCLMSSIFVCQMKIIEAVEPKKIVDAFGKIALSSLSSTSWDLSWPCSTYFPLLVSHFTTLTSGLGSGFVYDLVADCFLLSTYIGMSNQYFFAIPKKRTTVTYEIPGTSTLGPNIRNQII